MRNLIVIGASAGGISAISTVLNGLPDHLDAAVLVVVHLSRKSNTHIIATRFQKATDLKCVVVENGIKIEKGFVYIAPPDHHMMVTDTEIKVHQGPHENKYRPAIDVLFRSAAVNFGNRVIGIILTGMLDDGTSGMWAIKKAGGICIVQKPSDAEFSDMPRSVLNKMEVDFKVALEEIPTIFEKLLNKPLPPEIPVPPELQIEAQITENMMSDINQLKVIAERSDFICPDCGGGLWAVKNDSQKRYRCHTGHVYTEKLLQELQDQKIEESIWVAIRVLEEKQNMLMLMSTRSQDDDDPAPELSIYHKRIVEVSKHIHRLKSVLMKLNEDLYEQQAPTGE